MVGYMPFANNLTPTHHLYITSLVLTYWFGAIYNNTFDHSIILGKEILVFLTKKDNTLLWTLCLAKVASLFLGHMVTKHLKNRGSVIFGKIFYILWKVVKIHKKTVMVFSQELFNIVIQFFQGWILSCMSDFHCPIEIHKIQHFCPKLLNF